MKWKIAASLFFIWLISLTGFAQDAWEPELCRQTAKFDEFEYTSLTAVKDRLELFGMQLQSTNSAGYILGYGGKNTESSQGRTFASEIGEFLTLKFKLSSAQIDARDGGHRTTPGVELFIRPDRCSDVPSPSPTLDYDEVVYKEEKEFLEKNVVRKDSHALAELIRETVEVPYPPAAKAVRAQGKVVVLVSIDESGHLKKLKAIEGHPLLRTASEILIRQSIFKVLEIDDKAIPYAGKLIIGWDIDSPSSRIIP